MTFVVDIDDTLLVSEKIECDKCGRMKYLNPKPIKEEIKASNKLYDLGHIIILYTGRNWDCYNLTVEQLKECGIKYHELVMGKPQGKLIDKDAKTSLKEFVNEDNK
jgi:hydroxymethylpyrimidine pyrophosphatase-like HAD family hydrolase